MDMLSIILSISSIIFAIVIFVVQLIISNRIDLLNKFDGLSELKKELKKSAEEFSLLPDGDEENFIEATERFVEFAERLDEIQNEKKSKKTAKQKLYLNKLVPIRIFAKIKDKGIFTKLSIDLKKRIEKCEEFVDESYNELFEEIQKRILQVFGEDAVVVDEVLEQILASLPKTVEDFRKALSREGKNVSIVGTTEAKKELQRLLKEWNRKIKKLEGG